MELRPDFPRAKAGDTYNGWRCLDDDPVTGVAEWVYFETAVDGSVEKIHRKLIQHHSEQLLNRNKALFNDSQGKRWGDGAIVSSIPLNIWNGELAEAHANKDRKFIRRWLNDPDHRAFRTREGNL